MMWAVNSHNLLIFRTAAIGSWRPNKLSARVLLQQVSIEGPAGTRLAVRLKGVAVELAGKKDDVLRFTEALRAVLPT
jgi:hypothetical protein